MNRRSFLTSSGTILAGSTLLPRLFAANGTPSAAPSAAPAPGVPGLAPRFGDGRDWWFEKRFGMFIHWGIYAINGWHEQEQWRRAVPRAEYGKLRQKWNPVNFDPDAWLDLAEAAGMKYLCFTTKHHDGFCLWDTQFTDFNTMNTPYGKDVLKQLADACHRRKFPLCLYYSIADWHQPNYPNQGRHHELQPQPGDSPDWNKYLAFLKAQVRELCSNYGEIHGFWWDMNVPEHVDPSINAMIRELQPKAVINNRGFDPGDFGTPERDWDKSVHTKGRFDTPVEACQSVGYQSWGWREDEDYYSRNHLIRGIHNLLAKGGNYLLNVGPKPDGTIPPESAAMLKHIGQWLGSVSESLFAVEPADIILSEKSLVLTRRGNTLYVHLIREPETASVFLHPLTDSPRRAVLLNTGAALEFDVTAPPRLHNQTPKSGLRIKRLPVDESATAGWVLKLEFAEFPKPPGASQPKAETR